MRDFPNTADPVALDDLKESAEPPPSKTARFLLRLPHHTKRICEEAAQREGLSLNVWATRVLSEHAKCSREGWRSIPVEDNARRPPAPESREKEQITPGPLLPSGTTTWPAINPHITRTTTSLGSGTVTFNPGTANASVPVHGAYVSYPDGDIPEL